MAYTTGHVFSRLSLRQNNMAQDPRHGEQVTIIINKIEDGEEVATSTLVMSQVCGYLKWEKRPNVIPTFLAYLRSVPNLTKVDTTFMDFVQAHELGIEHEIDWRLWDDLVIATKMKRIEIDEIYSNDADFDTIPGVQRVFE
ncbi:MAG: type II toxin-antitoxin system VapC family toxin [Candidatus Geothermarchaeales archaeon]